MTISNSLTSIEDNTFSGCSGLTSLTIPNSVSSIGDYTFYGCSGLTSVTIPNSVTSIGGGTFMGCRGLTSVTIPNSVTSIGVGAFIECSGLKSVTLSNCITYISNYTFRDCSGLTSITIPNSVTSIGGGAFYGCSSLTSVNIPNSVKCIGQDRIEYYTGPSGAFENCSGLTSITIGSSVEEIYGRAFVKCTNLKTVKCLAEKVPTAYELDFEYYYDSSYNFFEDSDPQNAILFVPAGSLNAYKNTVPWSYFGTIKAIESTQKCATPAIFYGNKKLLFNCETEGVEYVYEIKDADIKKGYDSEVQLSATYEISVYATKAGYENSDIATATLVWGSATFTETTGQATAAPAINAESPLLIQSQGGLLTIQGADDGTKIGVYNINGTLAGEGISHNGVATLNTNLQSGSVAIIKIGDRSVKVVIK